MDSQNPISTLVETALKKYTAWLAQAGLDNKDHQITAMRWALRHELSETPIDGIRGGLIADEMGLGKTIILLGLIISNFRRSTLIVVPRSLLDQWRRVIERFFGHEPLIYHGSTLKKSKQLLVGGELQPIVLTTYGIMQTRKGGCPLYDIPWSRLICDEAHHLRNGGKLYQSMLRIKSTIKWMVTGTPLQNRHSDLQVLCNVLGLAPAFTASPEDVKGIILRHSIRRTKKQVGIKLPPNRSYYSILRKPVPGRR